MRRATASGCLAVEDAYVPNLCIRRTTGTLSPPCYRPATWMAWRTDSLSRATARLPRSAAAALYLRSSYLPRTC